VGWGGVGVLRGEGGGGGGGVSGRERGEGGGRGGDVGGGLGLKTSSAGGAAKLYALKLRTRR